VSRSTSELRERIENIKVAALDATPVAGLTHKFYRYPARFSPAFASSVIRELSKPGDLVLDSYMGGGTAIVESMALGRHAVGSDLNSLAVFIARVKTTPLSSEDQRALRAWAKNVVPGLSYFDEPEEVGAILRDHRTTNLTLPNARPIKKILGLALLSLEDLPSQIAQDFARCAMLNVGQWALNGRKRSTPLPEFRQALQRAVGEMLNGLGAFARSLSRQFPFRPTRYLINDSAENLAHHDVFRSQQASLVVTSPPYPGIHMLYHRWQVDGRRESPAPYWLAACHDGQGAAYYSFADRSDTAADRYFAESLRTLKGIRAVVKKGAYLVQMVAFSEPKRHLPRYLQNLEESGFAEVRHVTPIARRVPGRRWHANMKGRLNGSREIVLIHQAR